MPPLIKLTALVCILSICFACDDSKELTASELSPEPPKPMEMTPEYDWSSCIQWVHDVSGESLSTYPDDQFTRATNDSKTGIILNLKERSWLEGSSAFVKKLAQDISSLDGWGINAGLVFQFDQSGLNELQTFIAPSPLKEGFQEQNYKALLYMEDPSQAEEPHFPAEVPVELRFFNEGKGLIFEPLRALKSSTRYGLVIPAIPPSDSTEYCLAPSSIVTELLTDSERPELAERRQALLNLAELSHEQVAAFTVFTTQSALDESIAIAQVIRKQTYHWNDDLDCDREGDYNHCTRSFNALSFQNESRIIVGETPQEEYTIKVHFWRPRNRADQIPALLFGHGIGGDFSNAYRLDDIVEGLPIVRIAIDAVAHGEHPTAIEGASFQRVLDFFALDIASRTLKSLQARDNFRQSTYDKLQLIELLHQDPDLNQDQRADIRLDKLGYYGLSLGGIMGVELLSLEPRIDLGLLAVPGARLVSVLTDGSVIGDFKAAIYTLVGGKEVFDGLTPMAQILLDAADPGTYAPYLLGAQRTWTTQKETVKAPHLLMQMSMNDEVVPNSANATLARAINLPHLQSIISPIPMLEQVEGPLHLNHNEESTAALFQFDRVTRGRDQNLLPSDHMNVPNSREGRYQSQVFLRTWITDDNPTIIDPYAEFNIPSLDE